MSQDNTQGKKKKHSFPNAFTVLFLILILATILTYIIPSGSFDRLRYDDKAKNFEITKYDGSIKTAPASQKVLDDLKVTIPIEKFKSGAVLKPVAIPDTYHRLKQKPQGFKEFLMSSVLGIEDSVGIIVFVLILGGIIETINQSGAFSAAMSSLSKKSKGKEFLLVSIVCIIIAIGGTTYGMAEETIAFYPILMPIFLASGFDALTGIAAIFLGSAVGTMFSTVNAFSVVIASNAAGISFKDSIPIRFVGLVISVIVTLLYMYRYAKKVKKDPTKSLVYDDMPHIKKKFLEDYNSKEEVSFDWRKKAMLSIVVIGFGIMIWGVSSQGWWFEEMSGLFLLIGLICMFLSGFGEKKAVSTFIQGSASLVGVALIIGVARGINIILDGGMISDTILNASAHAIAGVNGILFSAIQMILFMFLGIFIPSSSGLAALSMPIIAPLADVVHIGRNVVVSAYNYGQGLMAFITPTGLILASLELVDVTYDKWLKYVLPLMGIIGVIALVMLGIESVM